MRLVLDVENTTQTREGKLHLDPFEPDNSLTMVGLADADSDSCDLEIFVADTSLNWPGEIENPPTIITEHCGIDDALNILDLFDVASEYELKAAAFLLYQGIAEEFEEALEMADDVHIIEHNPYGQGNAWTGGTPEETLGYYWAENGLIEVPDHVESYFNYKQLGRELLQDNYTYFAGDIYEYTN